MSDLNDQQIDSLIGGHLHDQLDRHVGAASRRFADEMARTSGRPAATPLVEKPKRKQMSGPKFGSFWSIGLVGAAVAAAMMIVSMRHTTPFRSSPVKDRGGNVLPNPDDMTKTPVALVPGEANVAWRIVDQGIVTMPDGTRARKLQRYTTYTRSFTDQKTKMKCEDIRPREETVYVGLKQY